MRAEMSKGCRTQNIKYVPRQATGIAGYPFFARMHSSTKHLSDSQYEDDDPYVQFAELQRANLSGLLI